MVEYRSWTTEKVSVSFDEVVLGLRADGDFQGKYEVLLDGKIEPAPPTEGARDLLVRQAAALRMMELR